MKKKEKKKEKKMKIGLRRKRRKISRFGDLGGKSYFNNNF